MSTGQGITYRPAAPGDVKLLTRMLWVAFNWRNEAVSEQHWPDPTAAVKYVDGFGRHGDAGVVAAIAGQGVGAAWYRLLPADDPGYGIAALSLSVEPDNAAMRLYLALGFERVGGSGGSITLLRTLEPAGNRDP